MSRPAIEFRTASRASVGARAHQEDASRVARVDAASLNGTSADHETPSVVLAVLADGMGGHVSGELASRLACDNFIEDHLSETAGNKGDALGRALAASNAAIRDAVAADNRLKGMGCTLVASYLDGDGLRWASVGDSALLIYRNGELTRLNADHSHGAMLDKQVEAGIITAEVAQSDRRRRALRSALTGSDIPIQEIEAEAYSLYPDDWVILASDGLLTLSGDEIATVIAGHAHDKPARVADALISAVTAKNAPHQDNTTVVAVRVMDLESAGNIAPADDHASAVNPDDDITATYVRPTTAGPASTGRGGGLSKSVIFGAALIVVAIIALLFASGGELPFLFDSSPLEYE